MHLGRERSFALIYRQHQKFLTRYLKRRGLADEDCEELIQEAFLRCFKLLLERPADEHQKLLLSVTRNLHIDLYRKQRKYQGRRLDYELEQLAENQDYQKETAQRALIEKLVAGINERKAARFFKLHYQDGYKIHEIASMTQTAHGTVASNIYRYRHKFQRDVSPLLDKVEFF